MTPNIAQWVTFIGATAIQDQWAGTGITFQPNTAYYFEPSIAAKLLAQIGSFRSGLSIDNASIQLRDNSFLYESSGDNITARAGGGQTNATQLFDQINRITTVATIGDSVKLPPSFAGLEVLIINHGANAMQVYGSGTDTIDDVASATGVSQMANSAVIYICATGGAWYTNGLASGFAGPGLQTFSWTDNITARAGGGQGSATALTQMINRVTTVASANDSVVLPAAKQGLEIMVYNDGANSLAVFPATGDKINDQAANIAVTQIPDSLYTFICSTAGNWECPSVGGGFVGNLPTISYTNAITARAGGGQGAAVPLTTLLNRITTVATAGDSVVLPASAPGFQITVTNAAAVNSCNVFPASGDAINGAAVNTAFALGAGKTAIFNCAVTGQWHAVLSA